MFGATEFRHRTLGRIHVEITHDDASTVVDERLGYGEADPLSATGHDGDLSIKKCHV
jgi:hypothetical protein